MDYTVIIVGLIVGVIIPILSYLNDMLFGNIHDGAFSKKTLEKLTVKQESKFRKILPFKEIKGSVCPKYLYIRIIPLVIHIFLFLTVIPLFVIDQLLVDFILDDIFGYLGIVLIMIFTLYNFILAILASVFKI